ncbi:elongation factor P 5-aminopentanone reductase [Aureibacillus halotolerans]|uniref:3-oxoacyl-[acyl-carrier protein] reductase n=1 Tax=Aureibacillus halotolerans TaxID=1508390 RepID=A0A4V3D5E1_9BACI|nr:SDR family NAD(P)-dependent oxidoreductase [Aureibacillus halotolerans]TDQ39707.1 3-oxoacyl-[acyl-carrier protein] reductase [Aureibacillus halotolerans]
MKHIFVTGASGAIGRAICEALLQQEVTVYAHYHTNRAAIDNLQQQAQELNKKVVAVQADMTSATGAQECLDQLPSELDVLIHAAGHTVEGLFQESTDTQLAGLLQVHVQQPLALTRHFLPSMLRKPYARVVFISSVFGQTGGAYESMYSTAKGGQIAFVKALAKETARTKLTVNAVAPGAIETPMTTKLSQEDLEALTMDIPAGRLGHVKEVVHAVRYFLDPASQYVTGHILSVNGGWYT